MVYQKYCRLLGTGPTVQAQHSCSICIHKTQARTGPSNDITVARERGWFGPALCRKGILKNLNAFMIKFVDTFDVERQKNST